MYALLGDFVLLASGLEGLGRSKKWDSVEETGRVSCGPSFPGGCGHGGGGGGGATGI